MVEIILRNDIAAYEPKPLFGFTYRAVATAIGVAVAAVAAAAAVRALGVDGTAMLTGAALAGGAVGFLGLGRINGMYAVKWLGIAARDARWPRRAVFSAPRLSPSSERLGAPGRRRAGRGRRTREEARDEAAALSESEAFCAFADGKELGA